MAGAIARDCDRASKIEGYKPLEVNALRCMDSAWVDIYIRTSAEAAPVLYCRAGHRWQSSQLFDLAEAGVRQVYVAAADFGDLGIHLLASIESFLHRDSIPVAQRFSLLQSAVSLEIERSFRYFDCGRIVQLAAKVGQRITELLTTNKVLPKDLFRVARHDYTTFTHVTNVACFAVLLIERLGCQDRQQLDRVAAGAILHDVGKRFIPLEILNKRGPLDRSERDLIESHPQRGYEDLYGKPGIDEAQLLMAYQHHERVDGTGYPVQITAQEIHPWAQALAVVDVFEAMTGRRPYRRPSPAHEVLAYLAQKAGTCYNAEMVRCWTSAMHEK